MWLVAGSKSCTLTKNNQQPIMITKRKLNLFLKQYKKQKELTLHGGIILIYCKICFCVYAYFFPKDAKLNKYLKLKARKIK